MNDPGGSYVSARELWGLPTLVWLWLGVAIAIVHQVYVWVHYYSTELPDMERIYGEARAISDKGRHG